MAARTACTVSLSKSIKCFYFQNIQIGLNDTPAKLLQCTLKINYRYNFMAALQTFEMGHILFRISILVGSVVLLLWISKNLVCKILMEKSNRKKSTVRDTKYDYLHQAIEFSPITFFLCKFSDQNNTREFQQLKDTVHLNGCARRSARIFSPHKKFKFSTIVTRTAVRMPELAWHAAWFIASIGVQLDFHIQ